MGFLCASFRGLFLLVIIFVLSWISFLIKKRVFQRIEKKRKKGEKTLDPYSTHILSKALSILIFFTATLLILGVFGLDIVPLLTVSGIGAAILGFASKDIVSNFFGGLMIYITRPFSVGDWIEIPGKNLEGTVEEIGWYLTTIRGRERLEEYIPNAVFPIEILRNRSRRKQRLFREVLEIEAKNSEKGESLVQSIRGLLETRSDLEGEKEVFLRSIKPGKMEIELYGYTKNIDERAFIRLKEEILLQIYRMLDG